MRKQINNHTNKHQITKNETKHTNERSKEWCKHAHKQITHTDMNTYLYIHRYITIHTDDMLHLLY